jgi:hypothetical protein
VERRLAAVLAADVAGYSRLMGADEESLPFRAPWEGALQRVGQWATRIHGVPPVAGAIGTNQVLTMHFGPHEVLAALSLDFDDRRSAADVEAAVSRIEREIKAASPEVTRVFEAKDRNAPSQTETPV